MSIASAEADLPDGITIDRSGIRPRLVCLCGDEAVTIDALNHHPLCPFGSGGATNE